MTARIYLDRTGRLHVVARDPDAIRIAGRYIDHGAHAVSYEFAGQCRLVVDRGTDEDAARLRLQLEAHGVAVEPEDVDAKRG